ncbi:MAG: MBOAT family protein [Clostridia bacterium]|nr:MBOAT family protein [Clostridia bacterium]
MLFNSIEFLLFFPAVLLIYWLIPGKARMYWLLVTSYVFYMGWNPQYALLLLFSTGVTWISGLLIGWSRKRAEQRAETGKKPGNLTRLWVALSLVLNLGILFFFKYFDFAVDNLNALLAATGREAVKPAFDVLLPVGISFYIFQALSYTMDVYRGDVRVEKNFFKYAVFVSFFPQLVAGPIERSSHLLPQFDEPKPFSLDRVRDGLLMMLWGFFQKLVIADRAAIAVNEVFNACEYYSGFTVALAAVLFAVQIYGDFAGYSCIAIGAGQVMGFDLMKNFNQPYFATSVADFWRRWHISLSTWFRDYLYIPLGGNRKGTARKYVNQLIVMLVSGLWHGAAWTYIIWGGLNGVMQVAGGMTAKARKTVRAKLGVKENTLSTRLAKMLVTFVLIDLTWIFFRANTVSDAFYILGSLFRGWDLSVLTDGSLLRLGLDMTEWVVLGVGVAVLLAVGVMKESGMQIRQWLSGQQLWFRWVMYLAAIFAVLLLGIYGPGYDASAFIYFQF